MFAFNNRHNRPGTIQKIVKISIGIGAESSATGAETTVLNRAKRLHIPNATPVSATGNN